jgi:hypothetical protein
MVSSISSRIVLSRSPSWINCPSTRTIYPAPPATIVPEAKRSGRTVFRDEFRPRTAFQVTTRIMLHSFTFYFGEDRCQYKSNLFLTVGHSTKNGQNFGVKWQLLVCGGEIHEKNPLQTGEFGCMLKADPLTPYSQTTYFQSPMETPDEQSKGAPHESHWQKG